MWSANQEQDLAEMATFSSSRSTLIDEEWTEKGEKLDIQEVAFRVIRTVIKVHEEFDFCNNTE